MQNNDRASLTTVSAAFVEDWISALHRCATPGQVASFLQRTGLDRGQNRGETHGGQRVTLDQLVRLYQIAAVETQDEMTGLWSRRIRGRALQHLLSTARDAASLQSVLYRYSTYWNLLLDDYQFDLTTTDGIITLALHAQGEQVPQRFGHLLILKLAHGLLSWLAGYEVPVAGVRFAFPRPSFAQDYAVIFPAKAQFDAASSGLSFELSRFGPPRARSASELDEFLARAPRDWMFTSLSAHPQSLLVREYVFGSDWESCHLEDAARSMNITPRTLMRRLDAEGTSFQKIKDEQRRDLAIRDLQDGRKSIEEISQDIGFSSTANFHKAFKRWTGSAPGDYRRRFAL